MLRLSTIIFYCVLGSMLQSASSVGEFTYDTTTESGHGITSNSCWSTDECLIVANLQFISGKVLPIRVNCSTSEKLVDETFSAILKQRYENISIVTLDGCGAALNANTFGFEYIPNCGKITSLNLNNFHFDEIYEIICESGTVLENINFERNEFARISAASFANLKDVKVLSFKNNNIRHIDGEAFSGMRRLSEIRLINEINLDVRYAKIFQKLYHLERLYVSSVGKLTNDLLMNLPINLDEVIIDDVLFDYETSVVAVPPVLTNLTIHNCAQTFIIIRGQKSIERLNLSANLLHDFLLENCTDLTILDLSSNSLTKLSREHFAQLPHLKYVYLQGNKLKTMSMLLFENSITQMHAIDLRGNDLKHIDDFNDALALGLHLRILIDGNPWNCIWLVNVSYRLPEQYRTFRYEKFISKINVNGLECMTYPADDSPDDFASELKNVSAPFHIVYGAPRESKRNQKAEALVIVFMLPLGIALLFVLLYLWINCQKVFHLSYYRNLNLGRGSAERFDVVRQLPHNINTMNSSPNQGYEIPMTCTCADNKMCSCSKINITYEETPHQNAAKIYEEIIDHNAPTTGNCYYDHLKFVDRNGESE